MYAAIARKSTDVMSQDTGAQRGPPVALEDLSPEPWDLGSSHSALPPKEPQLSLTVAPRGPGGQIFNSWVSGGHFTSKLHQLRVLTM